MKSRSQGSSVPLERRERRTMRSTALVVLLFALVPPIASANVELRSWSASPVQAAGRPYYEDNGGSLCAVSGPDFCVLAADTRVCHGYSILSRNHSRILFLGPSTAIGSCGCQSDTAQLWRFLQQQLQRFRWEGRRHGDLDWGPAPDVHSMVALLAQALYRRRGAPFYVQNVIAGLNRAGQGRTYCFDPLGSYEAVPVACVGAGRPLLQPILDRLVCTTEGKKLVLRDLSADGVVEKVKQAFQAAAERDISIGDELEIAVIMKQPAMTDADQDEQDLAADAADAVGRHRQAVLAARRAPRAGARIERHRFRLRAD
eukprot:scaffold2269_cov221-Pinguiococcus_pyrenoidosus.AAC.11